MASFKRIISEGDPHQSTKANPLDLKKTLPISTFTYSYKISLDMDVASALVDACMKWKNVPLGAYTSTRGTVHAAVLVRAVTLTAIAPIISNTTSWLQWS